MLLEDYVRSLVGQFAANQFGGDDDAFDAAYDSLLEIGPSVIGCLADIVVDPASPYRIAAIDLLECFHPILDSTPALPSLRPAMKEADPWLRLCSAEAIWVIDGESPRDIADDAFAVIRDLAGFESASVSGDRVPSGLDCESSSSSSEPPNSELARVRRRARNTLRTVQLLQNYRTAVMAKLPRCSSPPADR